MTNALGNVKSRKATLHSILLYTCIIYILLHLFHKTRKKKRGDLRFLDPFVLHACGLCDLLCHKAKFGEICWFCTFFVLLLYLGSLRFLLMFGFKLEWSLTLVSCTNNEVTNTQRERERERERVCSLCL